MCLSDLAIALAGEHQIKNSVTAVEALLTLRNLGYTIPNESIKEGVRSTVWHGRFEVIRREPLVIADGGHNQQCMSALAACVEKFLGGVRKNIGVFHVCGQGLSFCHIGS